MEITLLPFGKGSSHGLPGQRVPATLEFYAQGLPQASEGSGEGQRFASLEGFLELRGVSRRPVFINGPDAEALPNRFQYDDPLVPEVRPADRMRPKRIAIAVRFDQKTFEGMMDVESSNSHLVLPEMPELTLFVELDSKIIVDGQVEAETNIGDRLDSVLYGATGPQVPPTSAGFVLRDPAGRPPAQAVAFRVNDGDAKVHEGVTNRRGEGFVDGVRPGVFDLEFPELAFFDYGAEPLVGAASTDHRAAAHEDIPRIAALEGIRDAEAVYQHPDNEELRGKRPNPNQLVEGDIVKVPAKDAEPLRLTTGQLHEIRLKSRPTQKLRLHVLLDRPCLYELVVGAESFRGALDESRLIEHDVSVLADSGTLKVKLGDGPPHREIEWEVSLGTMEPVEEAKGLQARLFNLGFDPQGIDGKIGEKTKAAIRAFQLYSGLEASGEVNDETRAELLKHHDDGDVLPAAPPRNPPETEAAAAGGSAGTAAAE